MEASYVSAGLSRIEATFDLDFDKPKSYFSNRRFPYPYWQTIQNIRVGIRPKYFRRFALVVFLFGNYVDTGTILSLFPDSWYKFGALRNIKTFLSMPMSPKYAHLKFFDMNSSKVVNLQNHLLGRWDSAPFVYTPADQPAPSVSRPKKRKRGVQQLMILKRPRQMIPELVPIEDTPMPGVLKRHPTAAHSVVAAVAQSRPKLPKRWEDYRYQGPTEQQAIDRFGPIQDEIEEKYSV